METPASAATSGSVSGGAAAAAVSGSGSGSGTTGQGSFSASRGQGRYAIRRSPFYCSGMFAGCGRCGGCGWLSEWIAPIHRQLIGYTAGALFALGWWFFIDGIAFNGSKPDMPGKVTIGFEDWVPGIISTIALIIVNLIDRETLSADDFAYSGQNIACKARACAFLGVTLALGSLGGALAVLSLKFIIPNVSGDALYFGKAVTLQNFLIFFSSMILWFGRNSQEDGGIAI